MDKMLGVFTAVFVGVPLVVMCLVISWWMDGMADERDDDSDVRIYSFMRDRKRGSVDRHEKGEE